MRARWSSCSANFSMFFCCVVTWREAQLSWWPPRWVAGNEESPIKVSGVERFYNSKEECVNVYACVGW